MKPGCYIDGSQMSGLDFTVAVIDFAISLGFEIDEQRYRNDLQDLPVLDAEERLDVLDALDWTMTEALDYLEEMKSKPEGTSWTYRNSSLFLEELDVEEADA